MNSVVTANQYPNEQVAQWIKNTSESVEAVTEPSPRGSLQLKLKDA